MYEKHHLIKHKEATIVCEERGPINLSYNALLTTLEANTIVKPIIPIASTKSTSSCTNCGKTGHIRNTYHNPKRYR
jgi:hypothetical protein